MTSGNFSELSDGVLAVRRQLTDIHESVKVKHDLANAFDGSAITIGFGVSQLESSFNALIMETSDLHMLIILGNRSNKRDKLLTSKKYVFFFQNRNDVQTFWS